MGLPPAERPVQGLDSALKRESLTVGIDLDGVLGDQVADVLPRIKRRLGIDLAWEHITEFRLPLGSSDLAGEILLAQQDPDYLLDMPVHPGAVDLVNELRRRYRVLLVTARPDVSRTLTERWLERPAFSFDDVISATEEQKSLYGADVLIDDYTNNVKEFLERSSGLGILVDRPWNRVDRIKLRSWFDGPRFAVVTSLQVIPFLVDTFAAQRQLPTLLH